MRWFRKGRQVAAKARFSLPRWIKARFDAAQTTKDNAKHWGAAEFLSADAEADSSVRKILRTRARYEVQNNSYARGIVSTLANDTVGTGPRLQMLFEDEDRTRLRRVGETCASSGEAAHHAHGPLSGRRGLRDHGAESEFKIEREAGSSTDRG